MAIQDPPPGGAIVPFAGRMVVALDDESRELIRQLVKAVDRIADAQAPDTDKSFGDGPRRLVEPGERVYSAAEIQEQGERFLRRLAGEQPDGEGDHLLHDDGREGEELE